MLVEVPLSGDDFGELKCRCVPVTDGRGVKYSAGKPTLVTSNNVD